MLNMVALIAIPSAKVRTAVVVNPGELRSCHVAEFAARLLFGFGAGHALAG
jgi:hypothetical protein